MVVVLSLLVIAALPFGAEAAFRLRESMKGSVRVRYYRPRRLSRALERNADYQGVVRINSRGFRGPEVALEKTPGTTRVMLIGASTTFDPCARSNDETWGARLQHWLGTLAPGKRFEVINAGVDGVTMLDHVIRLQTELYAYQPDVYVMYAGHGLVHALNVLPLGAESVGRQWPNTPNALPVLTPWGDWLARHSRLYDVLAAPSDVGVPAKTLDAKQWSIAIENAAIEFRNDLRSFALIARGQGAKVVLVEISRVTGIRPVEQFTAAELEQWRQAFPQPPEVIHEGYRRFREIWQEVADIAGATFVPAEALGITGPDNFCRRDPIHYTTAGSEAMGRRLAQLLLANGVGGS